MRFFKILDKDPVMPDIEGAHTCIHKMEESVDIRESIYRVSKVTCTYRLFE
jgi:hypothetical protein